MSNWRLHQKHPTLAAFLMVFVLLFGAGATTLGTATPVSAVDAQAVIGMPFTGKWAYNTNVNPPWNDSNSSHPSVHHTPGGGNWATDLYATEGAAVKLKIGYASAGLSFSWASSSTSCGTSTRLNIFVGNVNVGWLYFAHLKDAVRSGDITNGMTLGTVKLWTDSSGRACNPGTHVHVEFRSASFYSCYVAHGNPGVTLDAGEGFGMLGSGNTGARQACSNVPSGSAPAEVRPTASGTVPWNYTVLEGDSGATSHQNGDIGKGAAVTTYNGSQQAFYYDATGGNLRHAWRSSGGSWYTETLDGSGGGSGRMDGNVGVNPSVAVYGDSIQVYYYDAGNGNLRHGWASSTVGWQFETLDGDSGALSHFSGNVGSVSKVVTFGSTLQIFYPNADTGNLRHAWADANGWHFENLDGDSGSIAGQVGNYGQAVGSSLAATVVNGAIQLFYYEVDGDNLRHAWYDTTTGWHFETLDGDSGAVSNYDGSVGQNPSVTYSNGSLQVFYYDASGGGLRHAWTDTNGWHFEALDGANSFIGPNHFNVGLYSSAISPDGVNIQLVYFDQRWTNLRHAWTDGSGWHFENLDGLGGGPAGRVSWDVGSFPLITSFGGTLGVFYYDILYGNLRLMQAQ